jgi:CHAT domain-containing protein
MLRDIMYKHVGKGSAEAALDLARAIQADTAGDRENGYHLATRAAKLFHASGNEAGELRAREEAVYALSRSYRTSECLEASSQLLNSVGERRYAWIRVQALLARATCLGRQGDVGSELALGTQAIEVAQSHAYGILELRAIGVMATESTLVDDLSSARRRDYAGLQRFWEGVYPPMRAYQFYSDLSEVAEKERHWETGYAASAEAIPMIRLAGNRTTEAMARYRLAMFAGLIGRPAESQEQLHAADALLKETGAPVSTRTLRAESLIQMAGAYLEQGNSRQAEETLGAIRDEDLEPTLLLQITFHRLRSEAALREKKTAAARRSLELAYRHAESALKTVRSPRDRASWQAQAGPLHRQMVRLLLEDKRAPEEALGVWEKYRRDSVGLTDSRERNSKPIQQLAKSLHTVSILSLVQFDDYLAGWLLDDRGIFPFRSALSAAQARKSCDEFLKLVSNPGTSVGTLQDQGRFLFEAMLGPIKGRLDTTRVLAIEPDGPLDMLPFEALTVDGGEYLGDRFTTLTSPGAFALEQWQQSLAPITSSMRVVVVADPRLDGDVASTYPELPDARREGETIASLFPNRTLLTSRKATLEAVRRSLKEADVFHFAGHGVTENGNSALLLAAPGRSSGVEYFDSSQVEEAAIHCRLAVLSACHSGATGPLGSANPDGLVQSFWRAGTPDVLAARWAVDSRATFEIVSRFYAMLLARMTPAQALRRSTQLIRRRREYQHPAYWAGFQVYGSSF